MPFDAEPRNGDYASYIDQLVNRGGGTPGEQGLPKVQSGFKTGGFLSKVKTQALATAQKTTGDSSIAPTQISPYFPTRPSDSPGSTPDATLAAQGGKVLAGVGKFALGILFGIFTVASLIAAFSSDDPLHPVNVGRTVVLFLIARVLVKNGLNAIKSGQKPPAKALSPFVPARRPSPSDSLQQPSHFDTHP